MKDNTDEYSTSKWTWSCKLITDFDLRPDLWERWGQVGIWGCQACCLQMEETRSNRRGRMAIDLQQQNRLINLPLARHVLTGCLQLWKLILFKIKKTDLSDLSVETERGECADVCSVKDVAVHRCCCCWDQDLCYCCYCQLDRLSMKGGLLRKSCECVCLCVPWLMYQ